MPNKATHQIAITTEGASRQLVIPVVKRNRKRSRPFGLTKYYIDLIDFAQHRDRI